LAGIAVTVKVEGAPQAGTKTIKCSSPANIGAISPILSNTGFQVTTAAGGTGEGDPGGETMYIPFSSVVAIVNT
jgi:hypothetical protein